MAAAQVPGGVIVADDRHDAGLHGAQRDEKEGLPLIIEAQRRNRLIGKGLEDQVQTQNVKRVSGLHQDIGNAQPVDPPHQSRVQLSGGGRTESAPENYQRRHDLSRYRGNGRAGDAQFRQTCQPKDQQGIQHDIDDRAQNLRRHGAGHIALRL